MSFFYTEIDNEIEDLSDGTSQFGRFREALLPQSIKIFEKSVPDLLVFASRFAELINYYNSENVVDGDWKSFYEKDEMVILAIISQTSTNQFADSFNMIVAGLKAPSVEDKKALLQQLFDLVITLAKQIDEWYKIFSRYLFDAEFKGEMDNALAHLSGMLSQLFAYRKNAIGRGLLTQELDLEELNFHRNWRIEPIEVASIFEGNTVNQQISAAYPVMVELYNEFYKTLSYLISYSATCLRKVANEKDTHSPHIALYVTFLKLLEFADDHINEITKRHLDFYFKEVLRQERRKATKDFIHLCFGLNAGTPRTKLMAGAKLSGIIAGQDNPVVFETEDELQVGHVELVDFKTLYVSNYPLVYVEDEDSALVANNIYAAPVANSKDGLGQPFDEKVFAWPLFGEEQFEKSSEERTMVDAEIGFIVSAPVLNLTEGFRLVEIKLEFDKNSYLDFQQYIHTFANLLEITEKHAFFKLISDAFLVFFTNKDGWVQYNRPEVINLVDEEKGEYAFVFKLRLKPDRESLDIYDEAVHGDNLQLQWPAVKVMFNNYTSYSASEALKLLVINKVTIDVSVQGYRNLTVHSNVGPVNTDTPFQPFGPIPQLGSYMSFGNPVVVNKYLKQLDVNIEWFDLPRHPGGFKGFYREYGINLDNDTFEVDISSISGNQYLPEVKDRQVFKLFHTKYKTDKEQPLEHFTKFENIDLTRLPLKNPFEIPTAEFTARPQEGYLRIALINPYTAFGHNLFPKVFSNVALNNATNKKNQKELPDQPYTPTIKSFEINYKASISEDLSSGLTRAEEEQGLRLIHLYPFGKHVYYPRERDFDKTIFPQFENGGHLYIGLRGIDPPETISILFQLLDVHHKEGLIPSVLEWYYLVDDLWKSFEKSSILSDKTNNLLSTGIVTIEIPSDITDNNNILTSGLYWIRVFVPGNLVVDVQVLDIRPNAVKASRVMDEFTSQYQLVTLPPNTITTFDDDITNIANIFQPYPSFGGMKGETEKDFYIRVSERLNHKMRAVTVTDFEKMVLANFPDVFIAKCFSKVNDPDRLMDGHNLQMVVLPKLLRQDAFGVEIPKIEFNRLSEIKQFITKHSSSFINAQVINPYYERVKVICSVKFNMDVNIGHYLQMLIEDIRSFISPWLFNNALDLRLGGYINKSEILTFIENRPYVQYVTKFSVVHIYKEMNKISDEPLYRLFDTAVDETKSELIKASSPFAVLISAATHDIEVINKEGYIRPSVTSVGLMKVKEDLIIGEDKPMRKGDKVLPTKVQKVKRNESGDKETFNFIITHD